MVDTSRAQPELRLVPDAAAVSVPREPVLPVEGDLAVAPVLDFPPTGAPERDLFDGLLGTGEDTVSLVLDGAVDTRLDADLGEMLASVRSSGVRNIVLELATVTFMDTAGLRFLFDLQRLAEERGGTLRLADPSDAVLDLVALSGARAVFGLGPDAAASPEGWPA